MNFKAVKYAPAGIQTVGKNRLRVEFDTTEQRDDTLNRLQPSDNIRAEPSKQLNPMIILKEVSKHTPAEELTKLITSQNTEVEALQPGTEDLKLKFERRNRNEKLYNAVLLTSPSIFKKIIELGRLNVDHQRIHVEEFVPLLQCYKCLQFGHLKRHCTSETDSCAHCGDNTHAFISCPTKDNQDTTKCYNCSSKNQKLNTTLDTSHSPTSDKCPIKVAMRSRVVGKINYGA